MELEDASYHEKYVNSYGILCVNFYIHQTGVKTLELTQEDLEEMLKAIREAKEESNAT